MTTNTIDIVHYAWGWQDALWRHTSEPPALGDEAAHIWRGRVSVWSEKFLHMPMLLSEAEHRLYEGMGAAQRRQQFLAAHGLLRLLTGRYIDISPSELLNLSVVNGRISCAVRNSAAPLYVSVAHAGDCVLIAFARLRVGVDVERPRDVGEYSRVVNHLLPEGCRQALEAQKNKPDEQARLFARYWTAFEALYKLEGRGLLRNYLRHVSRGGTPAFSIPSVWGVHFGVSPGYIGALATPGQPVSTIFYHAEPGLLCAGHCQLT